MKNRKTLESCDLNTINLKDNSAKSFTLFSVKMNPTLSLVSDDDTHLTLFIPAFCQRTQNVLRLSSSFHPDFVVILS